MKRFTSLLLLLALMVSATVSIAAKDRYSHSISTLPSGAITTLKNNFKSKVSLIKVDKELGRVAEYEVIMTDGSEVTFDRDGNWKEVDVAVNREVPKGFIPASIAAYVKTHQKGTRIVGIEKKSKGYEVELSNGLDMEFDLQGNFTRYDR